MLNTFYVTSFYVFTVPNMSGTHIGWSLRNCMVSLCVGTDRFTAHGHIGAKDLASMVLPCP